VTVLSIEKIEIGEPYSVAAASSRYEEISVEAGSLHYEKRTVSDPAVAVQFD